MTKVISLSDDAYDTLKNAKETGESFSEVIRRVVKKEKNIFDFFGKWPGPKEELEKIGAEIKKGRESFKLREANF